jgi:hypothetical protein
MTNHQNFLLYESLIRSAYILIGWFVKWVYLPEDFNYKTDEEYIFPLTDIPLFSDYTEVWTTSLAILLVILTYYYRQFTTLKMANKTFMTCLQQVLIPTLVFNTYFVVIHYFLKPWARHELTGFKISGHIFQTGIANGILIRTVLWAIDSRSTLDHRMVSTLSVISAITIAFRWYQDFCTAIFFHTVAECIVGYIFSFVTILFFVNPKK